MQPDWSVCQIDHTVVSPYRYKPRVIRTCQDKTLYQWSSLFLGRRFATDTPRQCLLSDDWSSRYDQIPPEMFYHLSLKVFTPNRIFQKCCPDRGKRECISCFITTIRQPLNLRYLRRMIEAILETVVVTKDDQTSYSPHLGHSIR